MKTSLYSETVCLFINKIMSNFAFNLQSLSSYVQSLWNESIWKERLESDYVVIPKSGAIENESLKKLLPNKTKRTKIPSGQKAIHSRC